ncbi:hypothetical protein EDC01DRAFT_649628 [Geopyxis carbonaria]|nr:hypothetical protein EDC01DRAFT_649628 [Geopyxis carbonaria]
MKFSTVIFAAGFAAVAVAQSKVSSSIPIPTETSSYTPAQVKCLDGCGSNLSCQAECFGNPAPTEEMVKATTECVAACPKGDGTVAQNERYSVCQSSCITKQYFASTLGAASGNAAAATAAAGASSKAASIASKATATGSASDSSATGSSSSDSSSDSSASGTGSSDSASASGTGAAASASASAGAASGLQVAGVSTGAFAIMAALFAL